MYQEDICMLKTAPNKENARKFMEFMTRPDVSAMNTTMLTNGSVNKAAVELLPPDLKNNPAINRATRGARQAADLRGPGTRSEGSTTALGRV